jgi:DNA-binding CsgD family transcriptional regulator
MCTDEEKEILRKIIDGLIALKIAETHHTEIKELL